MLPAMILCFATTDFGLLDSRAGAKDSNLNRGVLNVRTYGATGSGIFGTDDAASLQNTVNASCLDNNVSDLHVSATPVSVPPGSYRMTYPLWVNCAGLSLVGSGMYSSVLSPTYDFGPTVAFAARAYPGMPLAPALVGSTGKSFDFTADRINKQWINLRQWDGKNGPLGAANGLNINGLPAFSIEYYVNDVTAGDGAAVGSNSRQSVSLGQTSAFYSGIGSARWLDSIQLKSGLVALNPAAAITRGTVYYRALTYDGATVRQYACVPGGSRCAPIATRAGTGTVVQGPTEEVTIGPQIQNWPNGSQYQGAINGKVYSVRVSNIARWKGTIGTVPSAALIADRNTLILTNGEQAPGGAPFYKAYDIAPSGGYGFGWLFGYNTNRVTSGNYYIAQNGMRDLGIKGVADNSGIIYVGGKDSNFDNLYLSMMEIGIETFNLAYEARNFSNITILGAPGSYGIADGGGGLNTFKGTLINNFWACEVAGGETWINPVCIQGNNGVSRYGFVLNNQGGNNPAEGTLIDMLDDSENSGSLQTPIYVVGARGANTVLNVIGGAPEAEDGSPIAVIDSGGTVNFSGTAIVENPGGSSPKQIVQVTGSPNGTAVMTNSTLIGWGDAPLSSTAGVVTMIPCKGVVTLAAGAGTFSNVCVSARSLCQAIDTTRFANPVTLAAPSAGSVAMTGTGTDVIAINCN